MEEKTRKKRHGDRRDGYWLRDLDSMHAFTPYLFPNRTENEAFIQEQAEITNLMAFLEEKNQGRTEHKYSPFHVIIAALNKCIHLRPRMNRFVKGLRMYQRHKVTMAFVVKKKFHDDSHEALAFIEFEPTDTIDSIFDKIIAEVTDFREEKRQDNSTDVMDTLLKLPRFLLRFIVWFLKKLDFSGKVPNDLIKTDPNYATVFLSNLGSIKLNAAYHHLNNWGTNSVFVVVGEIHKAPFYDDEGNVTMRKALNLGITLDERIADGYYYAQTIKLLKHLIQNPELLDLPANVEVEL